jgi:hypothetical protein
MPYILDFTKVDGDPQWGILKRNEIQTKKSQYFKWCTKPKCC